MDSKPIGPTAHGAIDYTFVTLQVLAPSLFGLKGTARVLCYAFSGTQGIINALTDHPLGLKRVIPLRVHGELETPFVPALLVLPMLTGPLSSGTLAAISSRSSASPSQTPCLQTTGPTNENRRCRYRGGEAPWVVR